MTFKINICDLTLGQLNRTCLVKIRKFARTLEDYNGKVIQIKDDRVVRELVHVAKTTDNEDLQSLYQSIKQEISKHINSRHFARHCKEFSELNMHAANSSKPRSQAQPKA